MSHNNKTTGSSFSSGDQGIHVHEHAQPRDHVWEGNESVGNGLGTGVPGAGLTGSRQARGGSGDRVIYTEKVTKEFDAHGNVISQNVEHPKPGALDAFNDDIAGRSGLSGSSMGQGTHGRPMVSDDYNRTGVTQAANETLTGNASRERTQHTVGDKLASQSQKAMGKATSNPNQYHAGEGTAGHYNPLK